MNARRLIAASIASMTVLATQAYAVPLTWLNMAPTPFNSAVPNNTTYNLPGVGPVTITYTLSNAISNSRFLNPLMQNGNVSANAYNWGAHESFGATNTIASNTPTLWSITYTFQTTLAPGTIFLGVNGLGRTNNNGGMSTVATVNQNGTYLGDWSGGGNYGLSQYTGGPGTFSLRNSVTGPGGLDPWWNSSLAVVQINDPISSLTVNFSHLAGDGLGVNIAAVPAPSSVALVAVAGLCFAGRRRVS